MSTYANATTNKPHWKTHRGKDRPPFERISLGVLASGTAVAGLINDRGGGLLPMRPVLSAHDQIVSHAAYAVNAVGDLACATDHR
jgi:hypothetical protein